MSDANNKKVPDTDYSAKYPFSQVTITPGGHEIIYNNTPGKESIRHSHANGTYSEISSDGKKVEVHADKHFGFVSNGHSHTVEGAHDQYIKGGSRVNNGSGTHSETGEDASHGIHGQHVHSAGGSKFHSVTGQHDEAIGGGHFKDVNDGDHHSNVLGDKISFVQGTKYEQVSGEYGVHIPKGNMDFQINNGKCRLESGSDITIKSGTQITLSVGGSSITITSSDITIKASGNLILNGEKVKIQGGGISKWQKEGTPLKSSEWSK